MRGRLVEESEPPLPDVPLDEALARIEEGSRRIDSGDLAARMERARLLAAIGAIEAARRDLLQLDPSDPARAEIERSIRAGLPARRSPGPATAEAALAELGACVPLPADPLDTRARAIETVASTHAEPVVLAAAADAWLEAGDAVRATELAMRSGYTDRIERSLAALTWWSVPSADRSAGLVPVEVRPDPDAASFHQRVRSALLASPWSDKETLVLRGNAIDVVRVPGTVRLEIFCRDERGGGEHCQVPLRVGARRRTIEIANGATSTSSIDARDLEIGGPGPDHAIVVRILRDGEVLAPHAQRLATRVTRGSPARFRVAGGQVVRVDLISGTANVEAGAASGAGTEGDSIHLPLAEHAPVDVVVEGEALVLLYTGTTAPLPPGASLVDLPPPSPPTMPQWVDAVLDLYADDRSIAPSRPGTLGTFRIAAEAISDVKEQEEAAWEAIGPGLSWMKAFGAPWVLVEGWSGLPEYAFGGRAEIGTRWNEGRMWFAASGSHAVEPEPASHVVVSASVDQDVSVSSDVDLRGSLDLYAGSWSEQPLLTVDTRAWSPFLADRPLGVTLGASAIATPTRDLRLDIGGRVTSHEGALPDRAGPYAVARWLLGTTTVVSGGGTVQFRFANSLRSEAYLRPTIELGADHMRWLRRGDRVGLVARATVLPLLPAVEGTLSIRYEITGRRGLRDLPAYEEPFRSLREWPR
jgi:hypothetical protein